MSTPELVGFSSPSLLVLDSVKKWVRHPQVLYCASPDIALLQFPELVALRARLVHFPERDVHEVVTVHKVSIESFSIF